MVRVLYVVYWGAAEPLGQSLVLPAIRQLSSLGAQMTLLTFEKPEHLRNPAEMERIRSELASLGAHWIPLAYHKRPKWPATLYDGVSGVVRGVLAALRQHADVIHARTFVGGIVGWVIASLTRRPLIFHNEGFYPDEQVDGGVWRQGSLPHRLAKWIEQGLYKFGRGLIVLSHRAKAILESLPPVQRKGTPVIVVPSCVDLQRFRCRGERRWSPQEELRLVYVGSIGWRYVFERVAEFVSCAIRSGFRVRLRVLTPAHVQAAAILARCGLPADVYSIGRVSYDCMPGELADQHAGLMVLTQGLSEHGCSPTKVGEYWAVGLPVVITPNISDTEGIIAAERVGVVLSADGPRGYERALEELAALLQEPDLAQRCRRAAEAHYDLVASCARQYELYLKTVSPPGRGRQRAGEA